MAENTPFDTDPYFQYSQPVDRVTTGLAHIITLSSRQSPERGVRVTTPWDLRLPPIEGFRNVYSYIVELQRPGAVAGNHYHGLKTEVYMALSGILLVTLANKDTGASEQHELHAGDNRLLIVEPPIAHAVACTSEDGGLLYVMADSPDTPNDTFAHQLVPPSVP